MSLNNLNNFEPSIEEAFKMAHDVFVVGMIFFIIPAIIITIIIYLLYIVFNKIDK